MIMRYSRPFLVAGLILLLCGLVIGLSHAASDDAELIPASDMQTCLACHEDRPNAAHLKSSAHGKLVCQQCHRGVDRFPHPAQAIARKPACGTCHADQQSRIAGSMHRKLTDVKTGAKTTCAVCHGSDPHAVAPVNRAERTALCQRCHAQEASSVAGSVHNGGTGPSGKRPDCLSCHGNDPHGVSTVHGGAEKTIATCQQCHAKEAAGLMKGAHASGMAKKVGVNCLTCHGDNPHAIRQPAASGSGVCRSCHIDLAAQLAGSAHGTPGAQRKNVDCATCHGASVHGVAAVGPKSAKEKSVMCQRCHPVLSDTLVHNIHSNLDDKARARPQCVDCHGSNMHAVTPASQMTPQAKESTCRQCHQNIHNMVEGSVHAPGKTQDPFIFCTGCHASNRSQAANSEAERLKRLTSGDITRTTVRVGDGANNIGLSVVRVQEHVVVTSEAACRDCHKKNAALPMHSRHDRPDIVAGDHPTCFTCHGGNPHEMARPKDLSPRGKVQLCLRCHADEARMKRYGMTTDAALSYLRSFHGKAVMRFGQTNAATCVDCHGLHAVLPPDAPESPVNARNVTATCRKCHPNAKMNFSLSGANHISLKIEQTPLLKWEEIFFKILTVSVILGLILLIILDLRRKVFSREYAPESGRPVGLLIAMSFFSMMGGIGMVALNIRGAFWPVVTSLGLLTVAMLMYLFLRQGRPRHREKTYPRFNLIQRLQHVCLMGSFTVLVLTGMPLRFADISGMPRVQSLFGGFAGARMTHRVAAVIMILTWIWHTLYLIYRWKKAGFTWKSWTMFPQWKDVVDFLQTVSYGVGLRREPPKFDRFQFREKFDYFAVYWGMPIMVLSGLVLWFPTVLSPYLTNLSFCFAYIAHSDESVLAMLAIAIWHLYNVHFNPDAFPMNPAWLTGRLPEGEMAREHPLEKAKLDAQPATDAAPEKVLESV